MTDKGSATDAIGKHDALRFVSRDGRADLFESIRKGEVQGWEASGENEDKPKKLELPGVAR